jgi:hypothetical protein
MNMVNDILQLERHIEVGFNVAGGLPGVGFVSGYLRTAMGSAQIVAGKFFTAVGLVGMLIGNDRKHWGKIFAFGVEHIIHGALNVIIGVGEMFVGLTPLSLLLLAYRVARPQQFAPIFDYGHYTNNNHNMRQDYKSFNRRIPSSFGAG